MTQLTVFLRKEVLGGWRNKKDHHLWSDFSDGGHALAFLAKIMPDIFSSMVTDGIQITVSTPTSVDSWMQFYGNIGSLGLLVFVILFADTICAEIEQGTLINLITKGLPRQTILLAKTLYLYFLLDTFLCCRFFSFVFFIQEFISMTL